MVTLLDWPLVMNPLPRSVAIAMPCTPCKPGSVPTTLPASGSTTSTAVAVRNIQPAVGAVDGDVVPSAGAADLDLVDDFVAFGAETATAARASCQKLLHCLLL